MDILIDIDLKSNNKDANINKSNGFVGFKGRIFRDGNYKAKGYELGSSDTESDYDISFDDSIFNDRIDIFNALPIVNDHKTIDRKDSYTISEIVGFTGDSASSSDFAENKWISQSLYLFDSDTVADVFTGKDQLSIGMSASVTSIDEEAKTAKLNIESVNHLAIVNEGRAGNNGIIFSNELFKKSGDLKYMKKLKIGAKEYEVDAAVVAAFAELESELADIKKVDFNALIDEKVKSMSKIMKITDGKEPEGETYNEQLQFALKPHFNDIDLSNKSDDYLEALSDQLIAKIDMSKKGSLSDNESGKDSGLQALINYRKSLKESK